jgi:hypothetical protein
MKTSFNKTFCSIVFAALLIAATVPFRAVAQRFNHSSPAPARAPQPVRQAPPPPAPRQQAPVQENRTTINGGSRNIGNHDYNHAPAAPAPRVNTPRPADMHGKPAVRENANIYHTGAYHGLRPYTYHPYHPYVWGPRWHPVGFFINALAATAFRFEIGAQWYYYDDGCYYEPYNGGYDVVAPPLGALVSYLPDGYETVPVGDDTYYYYGGAFYIYTGQGYQVVQAPIGAVVSQLPVGASEQDVNGQTFMFYNGAYYQPISQDGQDAYEVVQGN